MTVRGGGRIVCTLRRLVFGFSEWRVDVVASLHWNRFTLALLAIPLSRAVFYPFGFVPAQFEESEVLPVVRVVVLTLLGLGAATVYVGVLARRSLIESIGLTVVWPLCIAYVVVLLTANWHDAFVSCIAYLAIAAACRDREHEIGADRAVLAAWHSRRT